MALAIRGKIASPRNFKWLTGDYNQFIVEDPDVKGISDADECNEDFKSGN